MHITFILFTWIFGASYVSGGSNAAWSSLLFLVLLFLCVLAHEFGHVLTTRAFGVLTPDVILLRSVALRGYAINFLYNQ